MKICSKCNEAKDESEFSLVLCRGKRVVSAKCKNYSTGKGKQIRNENSRKYRRTNEGRTKERARSKVNQAIKEGLLINPHKCSICDKSGYIEAHHEDYTKPLDVIWLCKNCHENIHHLNEGHVSGE